MDNLTLRDVFWNKVYDIAKQDKNVVVVTADMGAPALDKFKTYLSSQFIDVGIAEQQAISVAAGLALEGKKVFAYAIAPFITLRCYEHIRIGLAAMNIPVTLVGVGAGFSYDDSGPTHHMVEDISVLRILPNIEINSISDRVMSSAFAQLSCEMHHPNYVRLDRKNMPDIYQEGTDFSSGIGLLKESSEMYILATGNMVSNALEVAKRLDEKSVDVGVIDIYTFPIKSNAFLKSIRNVKKLVTLEEHTLPGGMGREVCEILNDNDVLIPVKRLGLNFSKGYCYKYGGRENIQSLYGLDVDSVMKTVVEFLNSNVFYCSDAARYGSSRDVVSEKAI